MENQPENHHGTPKALQVIGKVAWVIIWLTMLIWGFCGVNFVAVGIISFLVDLGEWGPRINGGLVQTIMGKIVFAAIGITLGMTSVGFFWLGYRKRNGAAVIFFAVALVGYFAVGWTTGVHSVSGGVGGAGY